MASNLPLTTLDHNSVRRNIKRTRGSSNDFFTKIKDIVHLNTTPLFINTTDSALKKELDLYQNSYFNPPKEDPSSKSLGPLFFLLNSQLYPLLTQVAKAIFVFHLHLSLVNVYLALLA